jgi:hypothetical protein
MLESRPLEVNVSPYGPRLTTWALQQVVRFLGYTGPAANVTAMVESAPELKFGRWVVRRPKTRLGLKKFCPGLGRLCGRPAGQLSYELPIT